MLGLLALTLRDLIEGDIPLGFGASKGYGACHATITSLHVNGMETIPEFLSILEQNELTQEDLNAMDTSSCPSENAQMALMACIDDFQQKEVPETISTAEEGAQ